MKNKFRCFGERLADLAADGRDISAPVPSRSIGIPLPKMRAPKVTQLRKFKPIDSTHDNKPNEKVQGHGGNVAQ